MYMYTEMLDVENQALTVWFFQWTADVKEVTLVLLSFAK